jgi:hypothetical protein
VTSDATGKLQRLYFDPFGARIAINGTASGPPTGIKVGFTGHRHEDELGLIDMNG